MYQAILSSPVYFCSLFCWTYDPRIIKTPYLPFELFKRQVDYLEWLQERYEQRESGLADKCRDVGFTWLNCVFLLWCWLTTPGFKGTVGSRKVDLVDQMGNLDAILPKIRFLIEWLPEEITPQSDLRYLKLINFDNGALISGEGGDQMGRGGRSSLYFKDEAAFVERPQLVDAAVSNNTDVVIEVSTPNGLNTPFATRIHSGVFPVFHFDWWQDPRKDEAWYQRMKRELDPIVFAQEVERDYTASEPGILIPRKYILAASGLELPPSGGAIIVGFDVADEGSNLNVCVARQGNHVLGYEAWYGDNLTESAWKALEYAKSVKANLLNFDAIGVGASVGEVYRGAKDSDMAGIKWAAVKSSSAPSKSWVPAERRKAVDKFLNLRAEMGWSLRTRFRKTYEVKEEGAEHPPEECISIPSDQKLHFDIGIPTYKFTEDGKIRLTKKADWAVSPDRYDALALTMVNAEAYQTQAVLVR